MPFVFDKGNGQRQRAPLDPAGRGRMDNVRGLGAQAGAEALSPRGKGKLALKEGHGVREAANKNQPDPRKPETCAMPVRILGHEQYKALGGPAYEQLLTLVFIRTMDLFRAFGIDFQLILGGQQQDGDVIVDASKASSQLPEGLPGSESNGPTEQGPTRQPPTNDPTREPPTGNPQEPPTRNPGGPVREPPTNEPGGPTRQPPGPNDPNREPPGTRPPNVDNPTREPPDFERPGEIDDDIERYWPEVAANETARVWGDPHFVGADGGKFDVQGEAGKTYALLKDTGLKFYGTFDGWGNGITVVGSTGLTVTGRGGKTQVFHDPKTDTVKVDGQELQQGQTVIMADGGTTTRQGKDVISETAEGYEIVQHDQGKHIDAEVTSGARGVHTGLMGQTFDADKDRRDGKKGKGAQGEGAIDGVVTDYEVEGGVFGKWKGEGTKGDVDGDGKITLEDARKVLNYAIGRGSLTDLELARADVDGASQVTMAEGMFIQRMAQKAGGMGRATNGNGAPITLPENGTLQLDLLSYDAQFASRMEAIDPVFKHLFHGANLKNMVGDRDALGPVKAGDVFNAGLRANALSTQGFYDLKYNGETFMVEQTGDNRWKVGWAGPNGLGKPDFSSMVMEVTLLPEPKMTP